MKTAISVPDDVFVLADRYASERELSRSELYTRALREYLDRHDGDRITDALDQVCAEVDAKPDPVYAQAVRRGLRRTEW